MILHKTRFYGLVLTHPATPATEYKPSEMTVFSLYIKHLYWFGYLKVKIGFFWATSELFYYQSLYFNSLRDFNQFRISSDIYYPTPRLDIVFQLIVINDLRLLYTKATLNHFKYFIIDTEATNILPSLLLSNCTLKEKKLTYTLNKPFNHLFTTPNHKKWKDIIINHLKEFKKMVLMIEKM